MAKKRALTKQRKDIPGVPFAFVNHEHAPDYPPQLADIPARDALATNQRYEGVIVYVVSDQTTYQLRGGIDNTDWVTLVTATGVASHTVLADIGVNTHVQIDTHIADASIHFTQAAISITESQISNLQAYSLATHNHDATYLGIAAAAASANALKSATTTIDVLAAAAPTIGQVLTATSGTAATWQTPAAASAGDIVQTGTPADTFVGYFTGDKNLSGDAGFTWITASARLNLIGTSPVLRLQDSDTAAATMTAKLEFFDSTVIVGEIGYLAAHTGDLSIRNTAGAVRLDSGGTADVLIAGNGNIAIGGFINGYAGTPVDGALLTWVTANAQAEFILAPTGIQPTGVPVDNQIVVFDSATSADGDPNFTWNQVLLTADGFSYNNANDQMVIGSGDLATPGISINGLITASPFINLQQVGVTRGVFRFNDASDRVELSSTADEIALRPGNIDKFTLTSALTTLTTTLFQVVGDIRIDSAAPTITLFETDALANNARWAFLASGEAFVGRVVNDAGSASVNWLSVTRTLNVVDDINLSATTISLTGVSRFLASSRVEDANPVFTLWDTSGTTAALQFGIFDFWNSVGSRVAHVGFFSSVDTDFDIENSLGDLVLNPSAGSIRHLRKSLLVASDAGNASINMPTGVAPTSPAQGDMWATATDAFIRIDGVSQSIIPQASFSGLGVWNYRTEIITPPATGQIRFNNADVSLATEFYLHETNSDSTDVAAFLEILLQDGAILYIQDQSNSANRILIEISTSADSGVYRTYGIQAIIEEGVEPSQNQSVILIASSPAGAAAPVTSVFGRSGVVTALQGDYDGFFLTPAEGNAAYSALGHSHVLASGATDVTATAAEVNLLDLAGLTVGWVLSADTATTASWKAPTGGGGNVSNVATPLDNQIAVWTSATTIEGLTGLTLTGGVLGLVGSSVITNTGTAVTLDLAVTGNAIGFQLLGGGSTRTQPLMNLQQTNSLSTAQIIDLTNQGDGNTIDILQGVGSSSHALFIDSGGTNTAINVLVTNAGARAGRFYSITATRTVPVVDIINDSPTGTGVALRVQNDNIGLALDVIGSVGISGIFNSVGIDDDCTEVSYRFLDNDFRFGTVGGSNSSLHRANTTGFFTIRGGSTGGDGGGIRFYGSTHISAASDVDFISGSTGVFGKWDASAGSFEIRTGTGATKTAAVTFDLNQHTIFAQKVIFDASTTADPSLNIPEGVAPTTPVDGDMWVTTTDIFARINGVSESLLGGAPPTHTGHVTGDTNLTLVVAAITGQTALTTGLAGTDELLLSDAGVIKRMDVSVMNPYFNSNLTLEGGAVNLQTAQATTSGSSKTFSSIPSWVTRIKVLFNGVSINIANRNLQVKIGDAGGIESTGYQSESKNFLSNSFTTMSSTTLWAIAFSLPSSVSVSGMCEICNVTGNTWVATWNLTESGADSHIGGGLKTLTGTLDRVEFSHSPTGAFDAGSVNVSWS